MMISGGCRLTLFLDVDLQSSVSASCLFHGCPTETVNADCMCQSDNNQGDSMTVLQLPSSHPAAKVVV